jgi:uncharacterized membrane protein YfcA
MSEPLVLLLVALIIFLTYGIEAVTGFGGTVLSLPFVALLLGVKTAVPVLALMSWSLAAFVVWRSRKVFRWGAYLRILSLTVAGLPFGLFFYAAFPERGLKFLLAMFMLGIGLRGILRVLRGNGDAPAPAPDGARPSAPMALLLVAGGAVHGAFGTGGPLVVIYASRVIPDKTLFRATLSALWLALSSIMMVTWTACGTAWSPEVRDAALVAFPFLAAGVFLGDHLHYRVNERLFQGTVGVVLVLAGFVMLLAS